jgi:hypothetical protein
MGGFKDSNVPDLSFVPERFTANVRLAPSAEALATDRCCLALQILSLGQYGNLSDLPGITPTVARRIALLLTRVNSSRLQRLA